MMSSAYLAYASAIIFLAPRPAIGCKRVGKTAGLKCSFHICKDHNDPSKPNNNCKRG
jgi:hypothetical protein